MDLDRPALLHLGDTVREVVRVSMGKAVAVIIAVAAIVLCVGKWLAAGVESGWS